MIEVEKILRICGRVQSKYGGNNPYEIARQCKIELIAKELGNLKGFYKVIYRNAFIFLNSSLDPVTARTVCAHELGHHLLHREFAAYGFEEMSLFSPAGRREYEANIFAAELLIPDAEITEQIENGYNETQIAAALSQDVQLVRIKIQILRYKIINFL